MPELVSVWDKVWLLPIETVPKFRLDGFAVIELDATPAPESVAVRTEFEASLAIARLPPALPAEVGVNVRLNV